MSGVSAAARLDLADRMSFVSASFTSPAGSGCGRNRRPRVCEEPGSRRPRWGSDEVTEGFSSQVESAFQILGKVRAVSMRVVGRGSLVEASVSRDERLTAPLR